jgi:hypothetical protein
VAAPTFYSSLILAADRVWDLDLIWLMWLV